MLDSAVLDTVLGLIVVFYTLAILCSGAVELVANLLRKRAKYLIRGIRDLLVGAKSAASEKIMANVGAEHDLYKLSRAADDLSKAADDPTRNQLDVENVMGHSLVVPYKHASATGKAQRNPSYLPAPVFAGVIIDRLSAPDSTQHNVVGNPPQPSIDESLRLGIESLRKHNPHLAEALGALLKTSGGKADGFLTAVEDWFNGQMDRVTGSYKRWAKRWVIVVATVVVGVFGIDSLAIAGTLYSNEAVRATVVQAAERRDSLCPTEVTGEQCATNAYEFFQGSGLPFGWSIPHDADAQWWLLKVLGLALSVGAAALGAPFWFTLLNRLGSIRNTGTKPPGSPAASSP